MADPIDLPIHALPPLESQSPSSPSSEQTARSVREEVDLLLDEHVQELEERRRGEAHHVVVVALDLAHQHPAQALSPRVSVGGPHRNNTERNGGEVRGRGEG